MDIIHSTHLEQSIKEFVCRANATAGVAFQPIPKKFIRQGSLEGGNSQGIDDSRAPYFWTVLQPTGQMRKTMTHASIRKIRKRLHRSGQ
jgi:hypothetical protein